MSLFEFYRMEIPLFVPSPALLADWHMAYGVLNERTWGTVYGQPAAQSVLPRHPTTPPPRSDPHPPTHSTTPSTTPPLLSDPHSTTHPPTHSPTQHPPLTDPNNELSRTAVGEWVALSDFYQWPHIVQFSSWDDLLTQLAVTDLLAVSGRMREYNREEGGRIAEGWEGVLARVARGKQHRLLHAHNNNPPTTRAGGVGNDSSSSSSSSSGSSSSGSSGSSGSSTFDRGEPMHPRARVNAALRQGYGVELAKGCTGQRG
jgi:hypothetical protein